MPANDPDVLKYGPATFTLANGSTAANPLATRNRYVFSTRGEGQVQAPMIPTVGLKIGKVITYQRYSVEVAGNIFNLLNNGTAEFETHFLHNFPANAPSLNISSDEAGDRLTISNSVELDVATSRQGWKALLDISLQSPTRAADERPKP